MHCLEVVIHKGEKTFIIETLWDGETVRELRLYILTQKDRFEPHNQNNLIIGGNGVGGSGRESVKLECMLEIIKSSQTDVFVTIVICMNELCDCVCRRD